MKHLETIKSIKIRQINSVKARINQQSINKNTIYHHLPVVKGVCSHPSINQSMGKGSNQIPETDPSARPTDVKC